MQIDSAAAFVPLKAPLNSSSACSSALDEFNMVSRPGVLSIKLASAKLGVAVSGDLGIVRSCERAALTLTPTIGIAESLISAGRIEESIGIWAFLHTVESASDQPDVDCTPSSVAEGACDLATLPLRLIYDGSTHVFTATFVLEESVTHFRISLEVRCASGLRAESRVDC